MKTVGFIGLGLMGLPMATNLLQKGFEVKAFDIIATALKRASNVGIATENTADDACRDVDVVITMLPTGQHTLSVYNKVLKAAQPRTLFIECSTIDVKSANEAHKLAEDAGMLSLDSPVSGGVGGAEAGTLTFMVGGNKEVFEQAQPVFSAMGARAVYCGQAGSGQAAKICNNMLLAISMIGACEAFQLADKLGLDKQALFDVMSTSSGQCWSVNTYCPVPNVGPKSPADNNYQAGFSADLMLKDLELGQQAVVDTKASTPLGSHAAELYKTFVQAGHGAKDFSAIIQKLNELN